MFSIQKSNCPTSMKKEIDLPTRTETIPREFSHIINISCSFEEFDNLKKLRAVKSSWQD